MSTQPQQMPIFATSSFQFSSIEEGIDLFTGKKEGHVYGRYGNPGIDAVAKKIANLESFGMEQEAWGYMTSSGMSAIHTLISAITRKGDKILTQNDLYGGTTELFNKIFAVLDIEPIYIDLQKTDEIEQAIKENPEISCIYLETPANPTLACIDISQTVNIAKQHGIKTIIDNTFATPYLQQPLKLGVDLVIHSTTKFLNGHGNAISGAIIGLDPEIKKQVFTVMKLAGSTGNPFDAWLTNTGMRTLTLRMDRHCSNAMALAQFLQDHPSVSLVNYPGLTSHNAHEIAKKQMSQFGSMLSFEIKGGMEASLAFMNKVKLCSLAPTLGDVDTLLLHPASSSHLRVPKEQRESAGISDGLIRVSVGIEDIADIVADMVLGLN